MCPPQLDLAARSLTPHPKLPRRFGRTIFPLRDSAAAPKEGAGRTSTCTLAGGTTRVCVVDGALPKRR